MTPPLSETLIGPVVAVSALKSASPPEAPAEIPVPPVTSYRFRLAPEMVAVLPANRLLEPPLALTWPPALSDRAPLALMLLV